MLELLNLLYRLFAINDSPAGSSVSSRPPFQGCYIEDREKMDGYIKFKRARLDVCGRRPSLIKFNSSKKGKIVKLRAN